MDLYHEKLIQKRKDINIQVLRAKHEQEINLHVSAILNPPFVVSPDITVCASGETCWILLNSSSKSGSSISTPSVFDGAVRCIAICS